MNLSRTKLNITKKNNIKLKNRKSQLTLIIILMLLILISILIYTSIRYSHVPQKEIQNFNDPLKNYVEACLNKVTKDAILIASKHAGLIYPIKPTVSLFNYNLSLWIYYELSHNNYDLSKYKIYLNKNKINNKPSGIAILNIPDKETIVNQLQKYINENINLCLNNYEPIKKMFILNYSKNHNVKIIANKYMISVYYNQSINISNSKTTKHYNSFNIQYPTEFFNLYENAKQLTYAEYKTKFIENYILNLISIYSSKDNSHLVPFDGFTFNKKIYWNIEDVKKELKEILINYMNLIPVKTQYKTEFFFYPLYKFDVNIDSNAESLNSDLFPISLGVSRHRYFYTIDSYMLVSLISNETIFVFPLEFYIKDNKPINQNKNIDLTTKNNELCNKEFALTNKIFIDLINNSKIIRQPINVDFICLDNTCHYSLNSGDYIKLPVCLNGIIKLHLDNGLTFKKTITTKQNMFKRIQFMIPRKYKLKLRLYPLFLYKHQNSWNYENKFIKNNITINIGSKTFFEVDTFTNKKSLISKTLNLYSDNYSIKILVQINNRKLKYYGSKLETPSQYFVFEKTINLNKDITLNLNIPIFNPDNITITDTTNILNYKLINPFIK